jgi:hypothetical protein
MPGHSRPKDGVALLAYDPGIHDLVASVAVLRKSANDEHAHGLPGKPGHNKKNVLTS